jgi:hypothetical protein
VRITSFRIINYKSFPDSGEMHLESGFNVILGRNNVGKTALAEAMSLRIVDKPHRSSNTVPSPGAQPDPESRAEISVRVEAGELTELLRHEMPTFYVPTPPVNPQTVVSVTIAALSEGLPVDAAFRNGGQLWAQLPTYVSGATDEAVMRLTVEPSGGLSHVGPIAGRPGDYPELASSLASKFFDRLYSSKSTSNHLRPNNSPHLMPV